MDSMDELRSPSLPTSPAASIIVFPLPSTLSSSSFSGQYGVQRNRGQLMRHADLLHDKSVQVFRRTHRIAAVGQDLIAEECTRFTQGVQHLVCVPACAARLRSLVEDKGDDLAAEASTVTELGEGVLRLWHRHSHWPVLLLTNRLSACRFDQGSAQGCEPQSCPFGRHQPDKSIIGAERSPMVGGPLAERQQPERQCIPMNVETLLNMRRLCC